MNYLDLFSGIGGFSLAMQRVGIDFDNHYASEIDKYARSIYARQFPRSIQLGDVTRIGDELGKIDIITGGFPCQTFSIAGARRGFEDTRGTLFFDVARLASIYRPRYMVLENVKGLLNHDGGNTIRIILDELRRLDYHVQLLLLNSKDFNVPQNRERVFFICSAPGERRPEVFHIRERKTEVNCGHEIIGREHGIHSGRCVRDIDGASSTIKSEGGGMGAKTGLYAVTSRDGKIKRGDTYASTLACGGHGCGNHSDMDLLAFRKPSQEEKSLSEIKAYAVKKSYGQIMKTTSGIASTLVASYANGLDNRGQRTAILETIAIPCLSPDRVEKSQNGRRFKEDGEPMFTLTSQDRHGVLVKSATKSGYETATLGDSINLAVPSSKTRRGRVGKQVAQTLDTACNQGTIIQTARGYNEGGTHNICPTITKNSWEHNNHLIDGFNIRRLTPIECERLQDFPDCWTQYGKDGELISDSQRYKTLGNSVTVRVVEAIMQSIKDAL